MAPKVWTFIKLLAVLTGLKFLDFLWDLLKAPFIVYVEDTAKQHELVEQVWGLLRLVGPMIDFLTGPFGIGFLLGAGIFAFWVRILGAHPAAFAYDANGGRTREMQSLMGAGCETILHNRVAS